MGNNMETRLTHAFLMAIIVILTHQSPIIGGEIGRILQPIVITTLCFLWAYGWPGMYEDKEK